ncbi:MAG TPA: YggT family protein [Actinomycetota bacterium]|nr:YggT family protein [Actinomycetota bacterium]
MAVVCILLTIYWFVLFARIISTFFPPPRSPVGRTIVEILYDLTEPVLRPLRNLMPPLRVGMVGLDLSPIIVFIALGVLRSALGCRGVAFF